MVLLKKMNYDAKITEIEGKIPDISNVVTKTVLTTVENKISDVSGLATKVELNAVDRKIPNITGLISKINHDKDINEIKNSYVTNSVLASKLGGYVPYTDYTFKFLLLENELDQYAPLNRIF